MKKISIISLVVFIVGLLSSCKKDDLIISVTGVTHDKTSLVMTIGDADVKLTATINPENATDKTVSWSSNNTEIVTIDQEGNVHALWLKERPLSLLPQRTVAKQLPVL